MDYDIVFHPIEIGREANYQLQANWTKEND